MNRNNSGANTNIAQIFLDIFSISLAYLIASIIFGISFEGKQSLYKLAILAIFTVIYILSNKEARMYNVTLFFYLDRFVKIVTKSWLIAALSSALLVLAFDAQGELRNYYFTFLGITYLILCINIIISRFLQRIRRSKQAPRAAFVGIFDDYMKFKYFFHKTSMKLEELGYILPVGTEADDSFNILGYLNDLENIIRTNEVDQIYFFQKTDDKVSDIQEYIDLCLEMGVTVRVVIDSYVMRRSNSYVSSIGTYPLITYHTIALNNYEQMIKRLTDFILSFFGIIVASPIMLITALAIKIDSPGPVIFKQKRVGQNGRTFHIYKFRSMNPNAEAEKKKLMEQNEMSNDMMFKVKDDPRITRIGKFIRKTSIDELPQLFNVLFGTMSLVGTRPPTLDEVANYKRSHWRRISIKPGITGIWQVSGRSNITDFEDVVKMDLQYIDNWTIFLDIKILFKTACVLFNRKNGGAY